MSRGPPPADDLTLSCMKQLSRWKRTIRPVVRYNCYVNLSEDDAELVQLLGRLLRVVSPESAGPGHGGPGLDHGGPRPGGGQARPDGVAGDGPAVPDSGERDRSAGGAAEIPIPAPSASEARALIELVAARGIAQGQLGTLLGLEKSTVSRLAAGLERKGWVRRGRDEANQRYIRLYLTPEGSRVAARVWSAWQTRQARILAALSVEERAGLASGLRGLIRGLAAEGLVADIPPPGDGLVLDGPVADGAVADGPGPGGAAVDSADPGGTAVDGADPGGPAAHGAASAPVHRG
jgi:DNA-binding MarR family transcriptional regulator